MPCSERSASPRCPRSGLWLHLHAVLCYLANVNNQQQVKRGLQYRRVAPRAGHRAGLLPRGRHGLQRNRRTRSRCCGATAAPQCGRVPSERTWAPSRYGADPLRRPFAAGDWRGGGAELRCSELLRGCWCGERGLQLRAFQAEFVRSNVNP